MKAIVLKEPGDTSQLVIENITTPTPGKNEVLIKTRAFSVNPVDIKTRSGKAYYNQLKEQPPIILGWDVSGKITEVGAEVAKFKVGDEVFGMVNFPGHGKAYAEYVLAPADHLALKPANISHAEAAATTLAALTAWQVLSQQAKLRSGERIMIQAASGGVGHFAVQLAKYLGAYVIGVSSTANEQFVRELGADEHIDYTKSPFEESVKNVDVVFDALGAQTASRSLPVLKRGGRMIAIAGILEETKKLAEEKNITASNYLVHSSGEDMKMLAQLLQEEKLKPHISNELPFENITDAHKQIESGRTKGKVVVTM
jgi:NADPH:quinone reductase-like Zn-dependent oxidoreductase